MFEMTNRDLLSATAGQVRARLAEEERLALEFQQRIGANLRYRRKRRGIALEKFASDCRVNVAALSRIESGEVMPSLELLLRAARLLNVSCLALTGEHEELSAA